MSKQKFPPTETKNAFGAHGHARDNGPASEYTGFKYPSGGGNDIGVYKQPMQNPNPIGESVVKNPKVNGPATNVLEVSLGGISKGNYKSNNPHGEKTMRGYGAATKGIKTRGPMA